MEPTDIDNIAALGTSGLDSLAPQIAAVGASGVLVVVGFTVYKMVARAIKSRGSSVG